LQRAVAVPVQAAWQSFQAPNWVLELAAAALTVHDHMAATQTALTMHDHMAARQAAAGW
jgi:hypothetical protein